MGSAIDFETRWRAHRRVLNSGKHGALLQRAWNAHGAEAFEFVVLESFDGDTVLRRAREQHYIDTLDSEYNRMRTAGSIPDTATLLQRNANIPKAMRGNSNGSGKRTPEQRARMSAAMLGRPHLRARGRSLPFEVRLKISEKQRGVPRPYAAEIARLPSRNEKLSATRRAMRQV